ncbi:MAG: AsmA-like C-terminal domain-containing protein [Proteobacteria bacterium]|nr:AsmA-like C-terminal domain-containing protein [Pseudomonadota bacterium]
MTLKRIFKIAAFLLCWTLALILVAPMLLNLEKVQETIIKRINQDLKGAELTSGDIRWKWFPIPNLVVEDVSLDMLRFHIKIAEARLFPDWKSTFRKEKNIARIHIVSPNLQIKSIDAESAGPVTFPKTTITIENGSFSPDDSLLPDYIRKQFVAFSRINGRIKLREKKVEFQAQGQTPFCNSLKLKGFYLLDNGKYVAELTTDRFNPEKFLQPIEKDTITVANTMMAFTGRIEGKGLDQITANINGSFPCFLIDKNQKKSVLDCGSGDISFTKNSSNFLVAINKLRLINPQLSLTGKIERSEKTAASPDSEKKSELFWDIDLKGADLDATGIRETVLALFGDNHIAKIVCDIVRAGKAKNAHYQFFGTVDDFNFFDPMKLAVDVETSTIHIPQTDLIITNAQGPITILNGNLNGSALNGTLGNSKGSNCFLHLGLKEDNHDFRLNLDIDADLEMLPAVLNGLVYDEIFKSELAKFSKVHGRAKGNLNLGDSLKDIKVTVKVDQMDAKAEYARLSQPLWLTDGILEILPDKVIWKKIKAKAGPHQIAESTGSVAWDKTVELRLESLSGFFDAAALYTELTGFSGNKSSRSKAEWLINQQTLVPEMVSQVITKADGTLYVANATINGNAEKPENWRYNLELSTDGLTWLSPLLPDTVSTQKARVFFSNDQIRLPQSTSTIMGDPIDISGIFRHNYFRDWTGRATFTGTITQKSAQWIQSNKWIPNDFFPKIPVTLKDFDLLWDNDITRIAGTVIADIGAKKSPRVTLDIENTRDGVLLRNITFMGKGKKGNLYGHIPENPDQSRLINWDGAISSDTVSSLLAENNLIKGNITGQFRLLIPGKTKIGPVFEGFANATEVTKLFNISLDPVILNRIDISGKQGLMEIKEIQISSGNESLSAKGLIDEKINGLDVKLDASSPNISWNTLEILHKTITKNIKTENNDTPEFDVSGTINASAKSFHYQTTDRKNQEKTYTWNSLAAKISLSPGFTTVEISRSDICGITMKSFWAMYPEKTEKVVSFENDTALPLDLENVLQCLGFGEKVIKGPMQIRSKLIGDKEKWNTGAIEIHATDGVIMRLALLSKIFKVVNLTDFFTEQHSDKTTSGLRFKTLDIKTSINDNKLVIEKAVIKGEGLNLFARGNMDLATMQADFTILIAPFKTIDAIVTTVPILKWVIGGENETLFTIPVAIRGDLEDPSITVLDPASVGIGLINMVADVLKLPYYILKPILPETKSPDLLDPIKP